MASNTHPSLFYFHPSLSTRSPSPNLSLPMLVLNGTTLTPPPVPKSPALAMTCFTMTLGTVSNLAALAILSRSSSRFRRRSRSPFLHLTAALLLTDLAGHVILGSLALHLHFVEGWDFRRGHDHAFPRTSLCQAFGACMVFFGLCPLLLGGAMAVERCLGITRPLLHATVATVNHTRCAMAALSTLALLLAVLPLLAVGSYTPQFPGTWCFLPIQDLPTPANTGLALAFSSLGLAALGLSMLCNCLSGLALLQARLASREARTAYVRRPGRDRHMVARRMTFLSPTHALDLEMMGQLAGITVVSCVCWTPFLVFISVSVGQFYMSSGRGSLGLHEHQVLLSLRLASWNQILDPWVYILLRRSVMQRLFGLLPSTLHSSVRNSHLSTNSPAPDSCLRRRTLT